MATLFRGGCRRLLSSRGTAASRPACWRRARYGAQWPSLYLIAPVWCFALGEPLCGASTWAGVLMPGVDRVGRYFPFTLARPVAPGLLADWLCGAQPWFEMAVELALSTLATSFDLERFGDQVRGLDGPDGDGRASWRYARACEGENNGAALGECLAAHTAAGDSLWWSEGSAQVEPALRVATALLDGPRFADLLDAARAPWKAAIALQRV
ncbi:type VI secretion system protein ImpM [Paraburkholderia sacchari]